MPVELDVDQRHLDHRHGRKPLQFRLDPAEDERMSDRLEFSELFRIGEYDPAEGLAVYLAFEDDLRPSRRDRSPSLVGEDSVTDRIGVDGSDPALRQ